MDYEVGFFVGTKGVNRIVKWELLDRNKTLDEAIKTYTKLKDDFYKHYRLLVLHNGKQVYPCDLIVQD